MKNFQNNELERELATCHNLVDRITGALVVGSDSQFHSYFFLTIDPERQPNEDLHVADEDTGKQAGM